METLKPGFYWYLEGERDAEVVRVCDDGEVQFCGVEAVGYLPSSGHDRYVLQGRFVGPIARPGQPAA